jgi:hypothetical protein
VLDIERRRQQARWRYYKRIAREREKRAQQAGAVCRIKTGPHSICGGAIRETVDRLGVVRHYCERCVRRLAGLCARCPRPVYGKTGWALYCAECKRIVSLEQNRKWVQNNRARKNASVRAWRRRQSTGVCTGQ